MIGLRRHSRARQRTASRKNGQLDEKFLEEKSFIVDNQSLLYVLMEVMITFAHQNGAADLILFVHGFTGGNETWRNSSGQMFHELLISDNTIAKGYDVAYFEYFTKLTDLLPSANSWLAKIKLIVGASHKKVEQNIGIAEISELLRTQIRFQLSAYKRIVIVAHSMGGLVSKSALAAEIQSHASCNVQLLISLAVPHLGANAANFAKLLTTNAQLKDLAPLSDFCVGLNDKWVKISSRPDIKYFYGTYDDVVTKGSAIGTDNIPQDVVACNDDHLSIAKPSGTSDIAPVATRDYLRKALLTTMVPDGDNLLKLDNDSELADEYFVLKLMLVDVHNSTIRHCKENFLNAEYTRKLFNSRFDQEKLAQLYGRIRSLYRDSYDRYVNSKEPKKTPGELLTEIHEKIVSEDAGYLKSALPVIHALHKKGMLQQLANDLGNDIWWSEEQSLDTLNKLKNAMK
jgi:pimeloyl-ACP methyl ester carboxylesterase